MKETKAFKRASALWRLSRFLRSLRLSEDSAEKLDQIGTNMFLDLGLDPGELATQDFYQKIPTNEDLKMLTEGWFQKASITWDLNTPEKENWPFAKNRTI